MVYNIRVGKLSATYKHWPMSDYDMLSSSKSPIYENGKKDETECELEAAEMGPPPPVPLETGTAPVVPVKSEAKEEGQAPVPPKVEDLVAGPPPVVPRKTEAGVALFNDRRQNSNESSGRVSLNCLFVLPFLLHIRLIPPT